MRPLSGRGMLTLLKIAVLLVKERRVPRWKTRLLIAIRNDQYNPKRSSIECGNGGCCAGLGYRPGKPRGYALSGQKMTVNGRLNSLPLGAGV